MEKRRITGREVLKDIKAGLDDQALMKKYRLSAQGLQSVFTKLLSAGAVTRNDLDARVPMSERTVELGLYICTACGNIQGNEFSECPRCGFIPPGSPKAGESTLKPAQKKAPAPAPKGKKTLRDVGSSLSEVLDRSASVAENASYADKPARESSPEFTRLSAYFTGLSAAGLAVYLVVLAAVVVLVGTSPASGSLTSLQVLLAIIVIGLPAILTGLTVFVGLRTLSEALRVFARISASAERGHVLGPRESRSV